MISDGQRRVIKLHKEGLGVMDGGGRESVAVFIGLIRLGLVDRHMKKDFKWQVKELDIRGGEYPSQME